MEMLKVRRFNGYIGLAKELRNINSRIAYLNKEINFELYDSEVDFIEKKIIFGDYFSLLSRSRLTKQVDYFKKALAYLGK